MPDIELSPVIGSYPLEHALQAGFGAGDMGAWGWGKLAQVNLWSPRTKAIFGLVPETDMTRNLFVSLLHPDDRPQFESAWAAAIDPRGDGAYELTCRIRRANDGAERWIISNAHVQFDNGGPVCVIGALRDITEEKFARDARVESGRHSNEAFFGRNALAANLNHFAALVSSSSDAIVSKTLDGDVLSWNAGATRLFGYQPDEMIGRSIDCLIPPECVEESARILACIRGGQSIGHYETVRIDKAGRRRDVSLTISPVHDASGNILAVSTIVRDITARKRIERALRRSDLALRQSQQRLRHAADAGRLTYADVDFKRRRLRVSENFEHVMGYAPPRTIKTASFDEAISRLLAHVAPADRRIVQTAMDDIFAGQPSGPVEFRLVGDDGARRWIEATWDVAPGLDGKPARAFVTGHDVTASVESRNAITAAKAEAERANEAKSKFLAAASHDLRQPVQALILLLATLERRTADRPGAAELVKLMKVAVDGLHGLLTGILDISRLEAGVIAPLSESVDLGALVRRLGTEYQAIAAAKGLLFRVVDRNLWARTDPSLLERALRNLIENALRYTEKGGVLLGLRRRGHRVSIIVVDTGIGIAADKQTEIFEEFYQVSNPGRDLEKGLGLGLAIVVRMAELLGAQVGVASKRGRGSGFSLSLPVDQAPAAPAISPPPPAPAIAPGGRILIIEDDPVLRVGLEAVLTQWGYEPLGAASGEGALELARRESGRFDMIIAEDRLGPGLTGMEAVEAIRRLAGRALPTLMLTGETGVTRIAELHAGDFAVLHKPATPEFLRQKLVELLAPQSR